MNRLIEKYNKKDNIIVVTSYPEKNKKYSQKVCAVGGFAKNTLSALNKRLKRSHRKNRFIVITYKIKGQPKIYEENNLLVCRLLERNQPLTSLKTVGFILKLNQINTIWYEFEFGSFGNVVSTLSVFCIPFIMSLFSKFQTIILHQVIYDLKNLYGHLGWNKNDIRIGLFNLSLKFIYRYIGWITNNIVVTETIFKQKLIKIGVRAEKIINISHGVDSQLKIISQNKARKLLKLPSNRKIILYFGYLSWYKGPDILIKYARTLSSQNKLLFMLAGGKSFTIADQSHYKRYLQRFNHLPKNVIYSGFVPEEKINLYYCAADLVVLPYRTMMSSSGPLSLAFSFEKPILLSNNLLGYVKSPDFSESMKKAKLEIKDIFTDLDNSSLDKAIKNAKIQNLIKFSKLMKQSRDYNKISKKYLNTLQ